MLFEEIAKKKNNNKYSNNAIITPKNFHYVLEKGISNARENYFLI